MEKVERKLLKDRVKLIKCILQYCEDNALADIQAARLYSVAARIRKDVDKHFLSYSQEADGMVSYAPSPEYKWDNEHRHKVAFSAYFRKQLGVPKDKMSDAFVDRLSYHVFCNAPAKKATSKASPKRDEVKCCGCEDSIGEGNAFWCHDDGPYCESCYNESYRMCEKCEEDAYKDDMVYIEDANRYYCQSCADEHTHRCYDCGTYNRENSVYADDVEEWFCRRCADDHIERCEQCSNNVRNTWSARDTGVTMCEECRDEHLHLCQGCNDYYADITANDRGEYWCDNCREAGREAQRERERTVV